MIVKFIEIANERGVKEAYLFFNNKPANRTLKAISQLPSRENILYFKYGLLKSLNYLKEKIKN